MATKAKHPVRAVFYTRMSLDKSGEALGVQRQLEACRALAAQLGWTIAVDLGNRGDGWFDDNDVSAMSGKTRQGFEDLLDTMKHGEIDGLICWQPDRLYRKLADLARLLDVSAGVEIRTVNGGEIDLSHATGRMLATILGSVATQESELKGERQRAAAQQLAERGRPKWRRAFGYHPYTGTKEADDGKRKIDRKAQRRVEAAYQAVAHGDEDARNITKIAEAWNKAGVRGLNGQPWSPSTMSLFLRSPRNAGLREYGGEVLRTDDGEPVKGTWLPLVDEELWRAAQVVLGGNAHGPKSVREHLFTGVLQCGNTQLSEKLKEKLGRDYCGGHLSGNLVRQAGNQEAPRAYALAYACKTCRAVSIRSEHVKPLLLGLLVERLSRPDAKKLLRKKAFTSAQAEKLHAEEKALLARLDAIGVERGLELLTGRQAKLATDVVQAKLDALTKRQQDRSQQRALDGLPLGTPEVAAKVEALSPDRLRAVFDVLATITVLPVGKGGHTFDPDRVDVDWKD